MRNLRDRRDPNHLVLFVTNRTERGLPFIPRKFMNDLIAGCMARAQEKYPVQICHFEWMSNHFHLVAAGQAKHLSMFMCLMQTEIAKSIKKLIPKYHGRIWQKRFSEQRLATANDVIEKIVYLYMNPVKARLVQKAEEWEGFSSLKMYKSGTNVIQANWTPSKYLTPLPAKINFIKEITLIKKYASVPQFNYELKIKPNVWKSCFPESSSWSDEDIYKLIMSRIKEEENKYYKEYNGIFIGMKKIKRQAVNTQYIPKKNTRTPFIICSDSKLRIKLIQDYKEFCEQCRQAWKKWKMGDISAKYVFGAYRPGIPIVGRLIKSSK